MLTLEDEYQIGRMIVRGLRDQDQILEDPEVAEYIRSLGLSCPARRTTVRSASTSSW